MPKLKLGAVVYALIAIAFAIEAVRMLRHDGRWGQVHGWQFTALLIVVVLTASLLAVGAVTRRGLAAGDGPWVCQNGWIVLIAIVACEFVVLMFGSEEISRWPSPAIVFLPHFIRRLHESYYDGVAEAEREIAAVRGGEPGEGPPPGR
ncbi:hypothetical protein AB0F43_36300 [Kribbella sp. NPDC023972]|uniref:hypothetical protein n=1 Tax=Kribbella sp. NPDC023972 TaxID=3154795 RepID=UPI0033FAC64A